jgi:ribonuclease HI
MLIVNCDGSCTPSYLGFGCWGFVIHRFGVWIGEGSGYCREVATVNVAEYSAVIAALEYLVANGLTRERVLVRTDSLLVVKQINGDWRVWAEHLIPLHETVMELRRHFAQVGFQWVPCEKNEEADALSRQPLAQV